MRITMTDLELGPTLGTGTVGTVYRARLKASGEQVAVKILRADLSEDRLIRARFRREMSILEKLQHPHIIRYYGGGSHEERLFFVMEVVEGGTVKDVLERFGRLSWQEVASVARQVCSALQHAHNHGIVHRDLKPGNLFLDVQGNVKLGDFGIARDTHSTELTDHGLTVGTHAYMSPEQITGAENITGQADLYSLGCVLFELLTGRKPFVGSNFAVLFEQHLHKPAPSVDEFSADCPRVLSDIIAQLLAKKPEDRPFNARTVQGAISELLATGRSSTQAAQFSTNDVAAADVIDPGMQLLSHKLRVPSERQVSWLTLGLVATIAIILVTLAAVSGR